MPPNNAAPSTPPPSETFYLIEWQRSEGDWVEAARLPNVEDAKPLINSYTSSFRNKCRIVRVVETREVIE